MVKCENGCLEIAPRIINCSFFVDKIFAEFFELGERSIYSAHDYARDCFYCMSEKR